MDVLHVYVAWCVVSDHFLALTYLFHFLSLRLPLPFSPLLLRTVLLSFTPPARPPWSMCGRWKQVLNDMMLQNSLLSVCGRSRHGSCDYNSIDDLCYIILHDTP